MGAVAICCAFTMTGREDRWRFAVFGLLDARKHPFKEGSSSKGPPCNADDGSVDRPETAYMLRN